jgi:hypothetical protein
MRAGRKRPTLPTLYAVSSSVARPVGTRSGEESGSCQQLTFCVIGADENLTMAKRRARDSAGKEPRPADEQMSLSERMRELLLRSSTVEDRRNPGDGPGAVGKRRRRTDVTSNESEDKTRVR